MTNQPKLSKVLGLNKPDVSKTHNVYEQGLCVGYINALDDLDQLSPDFEELQKISYYDDDGKFHYICEGAAIAIISSMNKWIKKG